jgi:hypothetical protein
MLASTKWVRPNQNDWYCLESVDLAAIATFGVYIIWRSGETAWTVRVGQGDIAGRLSADRQDPKVLGFSSLSRLRVTWAEVPEAHRNGMERYLVDQLHPLLGGRYSDVAPIPMNLPWAA